MKTEQVQVPQKEQYINITFNHKLIILCSIARR